MVDDPNVQQHGMVFIMYNVVNEAIGQEHRLRPSKVFMEALSKPHIMDCFPIRNVGTHYCYNNPILKYPLAIFQKAVLDKYGGTGDDDGYNISKRPHILRLRSHYGK